MSDQNQTRRSFIKGSVAKGLIVTNTAALAGLINTPGTAGGDTTAPGTTQPGTTQPGTTQTFTYYIYKKKTNNVNVQVTGAPSAQQALADAYDLLSGTETDEGPYTGPYQAITLNPPLYSGVSTTSRTQDGATVYDCTVSPGAVMIKQVKETPNA